MVIFRKLSDKVVLSVGRVRSYRLNRQDSVLIDADESCCVGSPASDDVSCASVAVRGGMSLPVPRAGTGDHESAGTAHVKGPVSMAGSWYLCLQQETACSMS
jgi:hypothetical protein